VSTLVETWFGSSFTELHPLLQRLHREGGVLSGPVQVSFGEGLAGWVGKRLAASLGVPAIAGMHQLRVSIHSEAGVLHWGRSFNGQSEFVSKFRPVGHHPSGHWVERSGRLSLSLGVEVQAGAWHWQHRGSTLFGIPLPKSLLPTTLASKGIEGERYRFSVEVRAPWLGTLMAYSGTLSPLLVQQGDA
jgi:Domain of unknown function (DUF4166)